MSNFVLHSKGEIITRKKSLRSLSVDYNFLPQDKSSVDEGGGEGREGGGEREGP